METNQNIQSVIKQFFDNVVIIDDELDLTKKESLNDIELDNEDLSEVEDMFIIETNSQTAATLAIENEIADATQLFNKLVEDGFVTFPFKYNEENDIDKLCNVIKNTKLLILDWNLENTTSIDYMGSSTLKLLRLFAGIESGLRCSIIYTREDLEGVTVKLKDEYECEIIKADEIVYFESLDVSGGISFLGLVLKKKIQPSEIVKVLAEILLRNKSITLHLMESANQLEKSLNKSLKQFNAPFEKVLISQLLTSKTSDTRVSNFINEKLLSSIFETHYKEREESSNNFIYLTKRKNLILKLKDGVRLEDVSVLIRLLAIKGQAKKVLENVFGSEEHKQNLAGIIESSISIDYLNEELMRLMRELGEFSDTNKLKAATNSFILFLMMFEDYSSEDDFKLSFYKQTVNFTKLLKFSDYEDGEVTTGTIVKNEETVLICITPVCDSSRLDVIENKLKFMVGGIVELTSSERDMNKLKNTSDKCFYMAIPIEEELRYVKWNFYDTVTMNISALSSFVKIGTLKRGYIQSIINRYIAYQSRAGIEEVFYKESDYISNFYNLTNPRN